MSYGISLWGGTYITHLKPLIVTQKFVLRSIFKKPKLTPSFPLFLEFNAFPLRHLFVYKSLQIFLQKCDEVTIRYPIDISLRNRSKLCFDVLKCKMECQRKCIKFLAPKLLNALPFVDEIPQMTSKTFKIKLKLWLFSIENLELFLR